MHSVTISGCPENLIGEACDVPCFCYNGGVCRDEGGCICPPGFSGELCEVCKLIPLYKRVKLAYPVLNFSRNSWNLEDGGCIDPPTPLHPTSKLGQLTGLHQLNGTCDVQGDTVFFPVLLQLIYNAIIAGRMGRGPHLPRCPNHRAAWAWPLPAPVSVSPNVSVQLPTAWLLLTSTSYAV